MSSFTRIVPPYTKFKNFNIIRPFLLSSKDKILEWAKKYELFNFVHEDSTNCDLTIRRNYIRHELLPLMKKNAISPEKVVKKLVFEKQKELE